MVILVCSVCSGCLSVPPLPLNAIPMMSQTRMIGRNTMNAMQAKKMMAGIAMNAAMAPFDGPSLVSEGSSGGAGGYSTGS